MTSSQTVESTTITTTLVAYGSGPSTAVAASASTPARVIRSPVLCRRCHGAGCSTTRSITSAVIDSVTRHVVRPAQTRRTTMPAARTMPTAISSPRIADDERDADVVALEARHDQVVGDHLDDDRGEHRARGVHRGPGDGDEEHAACGGAAARAAAGTPWSACPR